MTAAGAEAEGEVLITCPAALPRQQLEAVVSMPGLVELRPAAPPPEGAPPGHSELWVAAFRSGAEADAAVFAVSGHRTAAGVLAAERVGGPAAATAAAPAAADAGWREYFDTQQGGDAEQATPLQPTAGDAPAAAPAAAAAAAPPPAKRARGAQAAEPVAAAVAPTTADEARATLAHVPPPPVRVRSPVSLIPAPPTFEGLRRLRESQAGDAATEWHTRTGAGGTFVSARSLEEAAEAGTGAAVCCRWDPRQPGAKPDVTRLKRVAMAKATARRVDVRPGAGAMALRFSSEEDAARVFKAVRSKLPQLLTELINGDAAVDAYLAAGVTTAVEQQEPVFF